MKNNKYFEDIITRSTYHSNAIEGSTLTYAETYAILFNDNSFKIDKKEPREIYEVINHKKAMLLLFDKLKSNELDLNEQFIKQINNQLPKKYKISCNTLVQGKNTVSLVNNVDKLQYKIDNETKKRVIPYDKIFVVFDKDSFSDSQFNKAINMCKENGYIALWSNEAMLQ